MFITCKTSNCDGYDCRYEWNPEQTELPNCGYCDKPLEVAND